MSLLYENFEEFIEKNKSVFKFIGKKHNKSNLLKNNNLGIFKAVWEARQSEFDDLHLQIEKEQKERKKERSLYELKNKTVEVERKKFKDLINFLEKKTISLENDFESLEAEHSSLFIRRKELDQELTESLSENSKLSSQIKNYKEDVRNSSQEIQSSDSRNQQNLEKIKKLERQLIKAQEFLGKQSEKIVAYKQEMIKYKANEKIYSIDADRLKEELDKNIRQSQEQNNYVENLKSYIERYKENSLILQEQVQKAKAEARKSRSRRDKTLLAVNEVENKLQIFQKDLEKTNAENNELLIHNSELEKIIIRNKTDFSNKSKNIDSLRQEIQRSMQDKAAFREKIEKLQFDLSLQKQEVGKARTRTEIVLSEKEKLQSELNWMNEMLEGIGNKMKTGSRKSLLTRDTINKSIEV